MILDNDTYVERAEKVIKRLRQGGNMITTTQIRNLLAMTADIYNEVCIGSDDLNEDVRGRINYLKIRFIYEVGRDSSGQKNMESNMKRFVDEAKIIECIDEIKGKKKNYILFSKYMEALVAYHKFHGGKD